MTQISTLGKYGLIDRITKNIKIQNPTTILGSGDDGAIIQADKEHSIIISTATLNEGIDFDLTYFAPQLLGYKAVVKAISNIVAMNALPFQITISLSISAKIAVEFLDDFYSGVSRACKEYKVDLVGGDTTASVNGLIINVTAVGRAKNTNIVRRNGAKKNDLICLTGNVGAAYMGLQLLLRESKVLKGIDNPEPQFGGYEYLLQRYLRPTARVDVVRSLNEIGLIPTSMIDISAGLASEILQICSSSACGARIYLEKIPISAKTTQLAEQMNTDAVVAALNGGQDYELIFTVPLDKREEIIRIGCIDIIGHITEQDRGAILVTPDGNEITLKAQGFTPTK